MTMTLLSKDCGVERAQNMGGRGQHAWDDSVTRQTRGNYQSNVSVACRSADAGDKLSLLGVILLSFFPAFTS